MKDHQINRRTVLASALGSAALGLNPGASAASGNFRKPLAVQLYTVRSVIGSAADDVLRRISEIGYKELETIGQNNLDTMAPMLTKYGLRPVSTHMDSSVVINLKTDDKSPADLMKAIETAKKHGVQYLVFPYVPPGNRGNADGYRALCDKMNHAGDLIHAAGLTFCYHNHAFEFGGAPGERPIDIFNQRLDKKLVHFELDLFWVSVAGQDPVATLNQYKGRVPLVHLKDKKKDAPVMYDERVSKDTYQEVGSGSLDFPAILRTAESVGVKHYIVEQDQTPGDPVDSLKKSYEYLR